MTMKPPWGVITRERHQLHPRYNGCVGHWIMAEFGGGTLYDVSGYANHGTLANGATWETSTYGPATKFDGVDDVITCGNNLVTQDIKTLTIIARIHPYSGGGSQLGRILDKRSGSGGWNFLMDTIDVANGLAFNQGFVTAAGQWAWGSVLPSISSSGADVYDVALRYDANSTSNVPTLWVNGVQAGAPTVLGSPSGAYQSDAANTLRIGNNDVASRGFDGRISDIRLYNRLLPDVQILGLMANPYLEFELPRLRTDAVTDVLAANTRRRLTGTGI